jgi:hypothetical protein
MELEHTRIQALQHVIFINHEVLRRDAVLPRIISEVCRDFSMAIISAEDSGEKINTLPKLDII